MRAGGPGSRGFRGAALALVLSGSACTASAPTGSPRGADPPVVEAPANATSKVEPPPAPHEDPPVTAEPPPLELDCAVDADCVLNAWDIEDGACCSGCLVSVSNRRWRDKADAFCAAHPARSCPKKRCGDVPPPKCRQGTCTNELGG